MTDDQSNQAEIDFIRFVIENIVDQPDKITLERVVDELGILIILRVAKDDMGKVIGKSGQTIKALRVLLHTFGSKSQNRVNLKVEEPLE